MNFSRWIFGFALCVMSSGIAQAATVWQLDLRNNNGGSPAAPFVHVTMDQPGGAGTDITVTLNLAGGFDGATIEEFGFNTTDGAGFGTRTITVTDPVLWTGSVNTSGRNFSVFGDYEIAVISTSSVVDQLVFTIGNLGVGDDIATFSSELGSGGELFAVKLAAGTPFGAFLGGGTVVPIPAALPLFLSGLAVFGLVARKRRSASAA